MAESGIEVKRRGTIFFRAPCLDRAQRSDILKGDYTEQAIRERIAGTRVVHSAAIQLCPGLHGWPVVY